MTEIKKNEEKAKEIANNNCTHICLADCSAESYFSSENDCYETAMEMAEWKDSQCLGTLLRVFDLIANKRDAGEALEYIKETMEFIIKDHYGDADKDKTNKMIMKSYCNLKCIGNSENCISLAPCKNYNNTIHIFSEIDNIDMKKKHEKQDEQIPANSAWSEEDENCINYILINCMHYAEECGHVEELHNDELHKQAKELLKSLKDRIK